jgi:hypothetical protein
MADDKNKKVGGDDDDAKISPKSSKKPGRGDDSSGSGEVRVVREIIGAAPNWPKLTKANYTQWALVMNVKMQANNIWDAIEFPELVSVQEDRLALDAITSAVPAEMVAALAAKESAPEAWNAVKSRCVGSDEVRRTEAQRLLREFKNIKFSAGESVDDFTTRLQNLAAELETTDETVPRRKMVEKLLRVVAKSLRQVVVAIRVSADLSTLTLEDASGRLRAAQEADAEDDEAPPPRADGKLYLTREQWEAQARREKVERGDSSSAGGGSKSGARRGRARRAPTGSGGDAGPGQKLAADQCRRCKKIGHWARECPTKPKNQAAHLGVTTRPGKYRTIA